MPSYYNPYSPTSTSAMVLSEDEMKVNAAFIWSYMHSRYNWTLNAVAGMLGNIESESTMNPARPQNNAVNNRWYPSGPGYAGNAPVPTDTWYGYGLFQITPHIALTGRRENPYTYGNWALNRGYTFDYNTGGTGGGMEIQLDWLMSGAPETRYVNEAEPGANQAKWYQHGSSPFSASTPAIYGQSTESPEDCAKTFYWNLERSGAGSPGSRPSLARKWYTYLSGVTPDPGPTPPDPGPTPTPKRKTNFIILAYGSGLFK